MSGKTVIASSTEETVDGQGLRGRLLEASLGYHRAHQALSQAYDETDRLAEGAGHPRSQAWCRIVALRERAVLREARERCQESSSRWDVLVSEVLDGGEVVGSVRLFTSDEVARLLAFVAGESDSAPMQ